VIKRKTTQRLHASAKNLPNLQTRNVFTTPSINSNPKQNTNDASVPDVPSAALFQKENVNIITKRLLPNTISNARKPTAKVR